MSSPAERRRSPATYDVLAGGARAEVSDRGSRFLALVVAAVDEVAAQRALRAIEDEHDDATHVCWAWRLGVPARERSSDAGEPGGTAGLPILRALQSSGLSDALVAVVRWYGGTNLGRGGLVRAYGRAAREALAAAPRRTVVAAEELVVEVALERAGGVKRLLRPPHIELLAESYAECARLVLRVEITHSPELRRCLGDLGAVVPTDAEPAGDPR